MLEDALADTVGRLDVERDSDNRPERSEADNEPVELRVATSDSLDFAARGYELERRDRGGEVAVAVARSMGAGRDRSRDRDVRQRGEVGERQSFALERSDESAVRHAGAQRDSLGGPVEFDLGGQAVEGDQDIGVRDRVERVAAPE